jgi:hypothetical protein
MSTSTLIASLITPLLGRAVMSIDKDGTESRYTISKLSDKLGTLKDGSKGEYVILTKDGENGVVINMHPNSAKKLANKGEGDNFKLVAPTIDDVVAVLGGEPAELDAAEQAAVNAELEAEQAGEVAAQACEQANPPATETAPQDEAPVPKAAKGPSKKDSTVTIFKSMTGSPRKDIIARFKSELKLSDACCNTYFQNIKSGKWA